MKKAKRIPKMFRWVVELSVDKTWVADGFNLTDERALSMLRNDLQFAYPSEVKAKVKKSPNKKLIAEVQGYKSVKDMEKDNQ